jgi:hypothetical protein
MFGNHYPGIRREVFDDDTTFTANNTSAFVELATDFVKEWRQSWLDVTAYGLGTAISDQGQPYLSPTIVLVQSPVLDLSLFWNLRTVSDAEIPAWITRRI